MLLYNSLETKLLFTSTKISKDAVSEWTVFIAGGLCRYKMTVQALTSNIRISPMGNGSTPINGIRSVRDIGYADIPVPPYCRSSVFRSPLLCKDITRPPNHSPLDTGTYLFRRLWVLLVPPDTHRLLPFSEVQPAIIFSFYW